MPPILPERDVDIGMHRGGPMIEDCWFEEYAMEKKQGRNRVLSCQSNRVRFLASHCTVRIRLVMRSAETSSHNVWRGSPLDMTAFSHRRPLRWSRHPSLQEPTRPTRCMLVMAWSGDIPRYCDRWSAAGRRPEGFTANKTWLTRNEDMVEDQSP